MQRRKEKATLFHTVDIFKDRNVKTPGDIRRMYD